MTLRIKEEADIQSLINDSITESVRLEFKKEPTSNSKEIAKDVSAMANSEGGIIIYGLEENGSGQASSINWLNASEKFPERFENIVTTTINPSPEFRIVEITKSEDNTNQIYAIYVPKSKHLHMVIKDNDNRYYKRLDKTIQKMEHSEITERIKADITQEEDVTKLILSLNQDFKQYSNEKIDEKPYISYFIIPDYLNIKNDIETLKSQIGVLGNSSPVTGILRNSYKNSLIITNFLIKDPKYWNQVIIIHRNGIIEFRRNLSEVYGTTIFASSFETKKLAGFVYWAKNILNKIGYYSEFKLIVHIQNLSSFGFLSTMRNMEGLYTFRGNEIMEEICFPSLYILDDKIIEEKVLQAMKQIGNYLGISGDGAYTEIKKILDNTPLGTILDYC